MPVHERVYRRFDRRPKQVSGRNAFAIARFATKYARRSKFFWVFVVAGWVPAIFWSVLVYTGREGGEIEGFEIQALERMPPAQYEALAATTTMTVLIAQPVPVTMLVLTFLTALTGGAAIAEDLRRHSLELYFSKPVTPLSYAIGKWLYVVHAQVLAFVYPLIAAFLVSFSLLPKCFENCWSVMLRAIVAALFICAINAAVVLGVSSTSRSARYATVIWFVIAFFTFVASLALVGITGDERLEAVSYRFNLEFLASKILGGELFALPFIDASERSAGLSIVIIGAWVAGAALLVRRRLRQVARG